MKISSKSILSPARARARDPPTSLSTSLSRRLKNSGSVKGGASPAMFPTTGKKRGTFENPEPSSPKVTCIGQVRVRGKKKQAKKLRTLSRRHSAGEVSFRKLEQNHHSLNGFCSKDDNIKESLNLGPKCGQNMNQECSQVQRSWVHFPVTICEALRAFGSEFSCLIPCRTERGKEGKSVTVEEGRNGSCGAVFARWLVAVQDGDGGGERDIELVVGDEDEEEDEDVFVRKTRRHVFEDLEIVDGRVEGHKDEGRVSVCVPPKNALLLMRCRSDPMKSEALVNRSWEPNVARNEEEDEEFVENEHQIEKGFKECEVTLEVEQQEVMVVEHHQENVQVEAKQYQEQNGVQEDEVSQDQELDNVQKDEANQDQELDKVQQDEANQDQELDKVQQDEANQDQELNNVQKVEVGQDQKLDSVQKDEVSKDEELDNVQKYEVVQDQEFDNVQQYEVCEDQEYEQTEVEEESFYLVSLFEEIMNQDFEIQEQGEAHEEAGDDNDAEIGAELSTMVTESAEISETHEEEMVDVVEEHSNGVLEGENEVKEKRGGEEVLPDCLLMMLHEPKLSINVSKETWVCSTDFIRRPSNRRKPPAPPPPNKPVGGDVSSVGAASAAATVNDLTRVGDREFPTVLQQPARSSCSLPMAPSMAKLLEQKLTNAVGYEPFVLTRCKSEPMKTAASKLLLPESCVWENRKLEGLSRVTFGLGF